MSLLRRFRSKIMKILGKYFYIDNVSKFPVFYIKGSQTILTPLDIIEEEKFLQKLMLND